MTIPTAMLLLPLLAAAVILLVTRRSGNISALISVGSSVISFVFALVFLGAADSADGILFTWAKVAELQLDIGIQVDALSRGMMFVVTFVGMLVHVFSLAYMKDDEGKARYFAGLSIFMFSMTGIVLANNFAMMFIFWELVGVSSYILIGHWFQKNSAAEAAKKAFLTNRIGDFGFMIGILMIWQIGNSIYFSDLAENTAIISQTNAGVLTAAVLLIFCGAVGKSAQVPLHVWLPDAMEGPTPVSALIHAATMVAAGVYMMARVIFLVDLAPMAGTVIAWTGGITALLAALMALQQADIKKILAYSTLSQLGYMIMVIGLGGDIAAMFHLFTHAFFKALLFLGAGALIFACHHEQDIWKMGGLSKKMPVTFVAFLCGTVALIAVPGTSGFFSKEEILAVAWEENKALFGLAAIVAFLTAFYMVRLVTVAFLGKARGNGAKESKEVGLVMLVPLLLLAVFAILSGYSFIAKPVGAMVPAPHDHVNLVVLIASLVSLAGGAILGFLLYRGKESEPYPIKLFANKFYFDEIYLAIVRIFQDTVAWVIKGLDYIFIDGLGVRGTSGLASGLGSLLRKIQVGNIQGYAFLFGIGVILLIYFTVFAR